jgi:hypothetical protein
LFFFFSDKAMMTFKKPNSMKTFALFVLILCYNLPGFCQHPLVGTWEMISIKGINADGERFSFDTTTVRETKVITPTHYMLIAHNVEGDSLIFNRSYAGTLRLEGNEYIEEPVISSLPIFDNVKQNFLWKVDGDKFIQSGTFTRPDGKTIILDELVFRKVKHATAYNANPALGVWDQLSSTYVDYNGSKTSHTSETTRRFHIVTPTHWMRISHNNGKFEHAMGGTYSMKNGKTYPVVDYASFPAGNIGKTELTEKIEGDKLFVEGVMTAPDGKIFTWRDVFQKVKK